MFSFLKKENEEGEVKSSNLSDAITLIVIAVLAVGGYFWYQAEKKAKAAALKVAVETLQQNKTEEAYQRFCELADECPAHRGTFRNFLSPVMGNFGVSDSAMDKVIFTQYEALDSISDFQEEHYLKAEEAKTQGDQRSFADEVRRLNSSLFLDADEKASLQKWRAELQLPAAN